MYGVKYIGAILLTIVMIVIPVQAGAYRPGASDAYLDNYVNPDNVFDRGVFHAARVQDTMGVIIQFHNEITPLEISRVEALGLTVSHTFHVIPAIYAKGSSASVLKLNTVPGVKWVENNTRLEYEMDQSTDTINATKTWNDRIVSSDGQDLGTIDGTGVTAVVVDSGIDAGHPDLDYGTKTIMNLKSDSNMMWVEMENTDTSSGHGTHCAGTIAGTGAASGGARKGVAPGAHLIGLSTGEAVTIINALGGLEWVYDHTKPGHNTYNIRVVSNSWGTSGDFYDPEDAITQVIEKLTYENNVVVVFAAGNDGGDGTGYQGDSGTLPQTNPYANTPAAISVAAFERTGDGVASFSSRGLDGLNETFPDVGAPGVKIWSTAARRTLISTMTKKDLTNVNPYYFAISGTSMATPHISGVVALLWQACPEMRVSNMHDDYSGNDTDWWNDPNTRVHEAELILEASAHYLKPEGENGVPPDHVSGHWGMPEDFAQGYGIVDVQKAVGIALTLHELRTADRDGDGVPDYPNVTVRDAISVYEGGHVMRKGLRYAHTDTLYTQWEGKWTRFNNQSNKVNVWETDQSHYLYIPPEATHLRVELSYNPLSTKDRLKISSINMVADYTGDGTPDWRQTEGTYRDGHRISEIDLSDDQKGTIWNFNVEGRGAGFGILDLVLKGPNSQYPEIIVPYSVSVTMTLDTSMAQDADTVLSNCTAPEKDELSGSKIIVVKVQDYHAAYGQWDFADPSPDYSGGTIVLPRNFYDTGRMVMPEEKTTAPAQAENNYTWLVILVLVLAALAGYYLYYRKKKGKPGASEEGRVDEK